MLPRQVRCIATCSHGTFLPPTLVILFHYRLGRFLFQIPSLSCRAEARGLFLPCAPRRKPPYEHKQSIVPIPLRTPQNTNQHLFQPPNLALLSRPVLSTKFMIKGNRASLSFQLFVQIQQHRAPTAIFHRAPQIPAFLINGFVRHIYR